MKMTKYIVVEPRNLENKYWKSPTDFRFLAEDIIIQLGVHEAIEAGRHLPLAFIKKNDSYRLIALTGLNQNENVIVDSKNGQWLVDYLPDFAQTYPFRLMNNKKNKLLVVVDEESDLLTNNVNDHPFFNENGKVAKELELVIQRLERLQQGQTACVELGEALDYVNILEPWDIEVNTENSNHKLTGLYRVNKKALSDLGNVRFLSLRKNNALMLAYAQLFSMGNIHKLAHLAHQR